MVPTGANPPAKIRAVSYGFSAKAEEQSAPFAKNDGVVQNKLVALRKILKTH